MNRRLMMKKIICLILLLSAMISTTRAEDNKTIPTFQPDGNIVSGLKKLSLDKFGVPHLTVSKHVELLFETHILLDKHYLTPDKMLNAKRQTNQHYKISTFSSNFPEINLTFMSELHLQESGKVKMTTLFAIPTGYELKYAVFKIFILPTKTSAPIIVSGDGKKEELKKVSTKAFKRVFNNIKQITFFPDNPKLRFSLTSNTPFILQRENGIYYIHLSLKKPCILDIDLN